MFMQNTKTIRIRDLGNLFFWVGRHAALTKKNPAQAKWIAEQF